MFQVHLILRFQFFFSREKLLFNSFKVTGNKEYIEEGTMFLGPSKMTHLICLPVL